MKRRAWNINDALDEQDRQRLKGARARERQRRLEAQASDLKAKLAKALAQADKARREASDCFDRAERALDTCQDCSVYIHGRGGKRLVDDVYCVLDPATGEVVCDPYKYRCGACQEVARLDPARRFTCVRGDAKPTVLG